MNNSEKLKDFAPELLDALKNLLEAYEEFQNPEDGVAQDAREVIDKCLGILN